MIPAWTLKLALAGIVALVVAVTFGMTYRAGREASDTRWTAKWEQREAELLDATQKEAIRQAQATADVKRRESLTVYALENEKRNLEATILELRDEAALDPRADDACLSDASRVRLNRVR